jgi:hypothetical protein
MDDLRRLADAVLYEGYLLWPYRRSALKNQRRWTFGGVFPRAHAERHPDDRAEVCTQVLVEGPAEATLQVTLRFLHVVHRQVLDGGAAVDELERGGARHLTWDEATEREIVAGPAGLGRTRRLPVDVRAGRAVEDLPGDAAIVRSWHGIVATLEVAGERLAADLHRMTVRLANCSPWPGGTREDAQRWALCSAHVVLRVAGGARLISATDPPARHAEAAAACRHEGLWPVLVGEAGSADTMLAAPIILEDHPRIAPESPGDLFDGGEIDQMLTLNILSLTDAEKAEMAASDPRARQILDRTEALTEDEILRLNGAIREFSEVRER